MIGHSGKRALDEDAVVLSELLRALRRGVERGVEFLDEQPVVRCRSEAGEILHLRIFRDGPVLHSQVDEGFLPFRLQCADALRELRFLPIHGLDGFEVDDDESLVLLLAERDERAVCLVEFVECLNEFLPHAVSPVLPRSCRVP